MLEKIQKAFKEAFGISDAEFSLDITTENIAAWDSIGHFRLVTALENQFSIKFEIDEIMEMESVKNIIEILEQKSITQ